MEVRQLAAICIAVFGIGFQLAQTGQLRKAEIYNGWHFLGGIISAIIMLWLVGVF